MHRILAGLSLGFVLLLASVTSAPAQSAPNGSYLQSCSNISVHGGMVTASCTSPNGQYVRSSLNYQQCRGDIANVNGTLTCNGSGQYYNGGGGWHGGGGGGGGAPGGSYTQSCTNVYMRGSILSASCTPPSGPRLNSSLDVRSCRGGDITNVNGQLACAGRYSGGGGYYPGGGGGGGNGPPGSYQQSCSNIYMNGSTVTATCSATNGQRITSSLNPNRCHPGTDIANVNGRLECLSYR